MRFLKARYGFTQIELVIYCTISVIVLGVALMFFLRGRRTYEAGNQSYLVSADAESALRYLKADLSATTLSSVQVYPNAAKASEPAGLALMSAVGQDEKFKINNYGAPAWSKDVFYSVVPGANGTGDLVRWEKPLPATGFDGVPRMPTDLPSTFSEARDRRVVLRGITPANYVLPDKARLGTAGGFRCTFVRSTTDGELRSDRNGESLTTYNPAQVTASKAGSLSFSGNTRLVDVQLVVTTPRSSTGQSTVAVLPFRICPRN